MLLIQRVWMHNTSDELLLPLYCPDSEVSVAAFEINE